MKTKKALGIGLVAVLGSIMFGKVVANGYNSDYVYFSDEHLRSNIVGNITNNEEHPQIVENELPTKEQVMNYGYDTNNYGEKEVSFEGGKSIEGVQYLPESVSALWGSESDIRDLSPLYDGRNSITGKTGMNQLEKISLRTAYVVDGRELSDILNLDNLKTVEIWDSNKDFKDFFEVLDYLRNDNLEKIRYSNWTEYPVQTVNYEENEFVLKSPILINTNPDYEGGVLEYSSRNSNFTVQDEELKWILGPSQTSVNFDWKYTYQENGKDFEFSGNVSVHLNRVDE